MGLLGVMLVAAMTMTSCENDGPTVVPPRYEGDYLTGSGFYIEEADAQVVDNLVLLGKVWGYVKYYHPKFSDTAIKADYELFELLPKVAGATKSECKEILLEWVESFGKIQTADWMEQWISGQKPTAELGWLDDEALLGKELSERLNEIKLAVRNGTNYYATIRQGRLVNFELGESLHWPEETWDKDTGYALLTLFRLWNMAEYYFPSVGMTNKKWSDVLVEYVPRYVTMDSEDEHVMTTAELIAELSDTHSFMDENRLNKWFKLPVVLGFVEGKLVVTDADKFADEEGISPFELGDEIISISGNTPEYFVELARKYISASNESVLRRDAADLATGVDNDEVQNIVIERNGERITMNVAPIHIVDAYYIGVDWLQEKTYHELIEDGTIGYLYPAKYRNSDAGAIMAQFAGTKGIVIDMRCYPSNYMIYDFVGRYFVPGEAKFVTLTFPNGSLPGYYQERTNSFGEAGGNAYTGTVVVLVNAQTQSQAEYTTMAFQAVPNTIVVGSQTAGADGDIVRLPLPRNLGTSFSSLGVYYPDGTNTQRVGVRIDYPIEPTLEGVRAGRDELLEKAIEIIKSR